MGYGLDKFRVGQMVRNKKAISSLPLNAVGEIIQQRTYYSAVPDFKQDWYYHVRFPGHDNLTRWKDVYSRVESDLEPIYDGDQPASWEDCAWKPEKVKA